MVPADLVTTLQQPALLWHCLTLAAVFLLALVVVARTKRHAPRGSGKSRGGSIDLQPVLERHGSHLSDLASRTEALEQAVPGALSRLAVLRYDAFSNTGGGMSFSLALLDGQDNGVIITSLFGRDEGRVYAKEISAGKSVQTLSAEEDRVLATAMADRSLVNPHKSVRTRR